MAKILSEYEDQNAMQYSELDVNKHVFNNPNNAQLKESLTQVPTEQRNPFTDLYHWAKGEVYDINALKTAIDIRNQHLLRASLPRRRGYVGEIS